MKPTEFWLWIVPSETPPGRRIRTRHRMTEEEALKRHGPTAEKIPGTCQVIHLDEGEHQPQVWWGHDLKGSE